MVATLDLGTGSEPAGWTPPPQLRLSAPRLDLFHPRAPAPARSAQPVQDDDSAQQTDMQRLVHLRLETRLVAQPAPFLSPGTAPPDLGQPSLRKLYLQCAHFISPTPTLTYPPYRRPHIPAPLRAAHLEMWQCGGGPRHRSALALLQLLSTEIVSPSSPMLFTSSIIISLCGFKDIYGVDEQDLPDAERESADIIPSSSCSRTSSPSSLFQESDGSMWAYSSKIFYHPEAAAIYSQYRHLRGAVAQLQDQPGPEAEAQRQRLGAFLDERREVMEAHRSTLMEFNDWRRKLRSEAKGCRARRTPRLVRKVVNRFVKQGYSIRDVEEGVVGDFRLVEDYLWGGLTTKAWKKIQEILTPLIHSATEKRVERERNLYRTQCAHILDTVRSQWAMSVVPPIEWPYLPPRSELVEWAPIWSVLERTRVEELRLECFADERETGGGFERLWGEMSRSADEWRARKMRELAELLVPVEPINTRQEGGEDASCTTGEMEGRSLYFGRLFCPPGPSPRLPSSSLSPSNRYYSSDLDRELDLSSLSLAMSVFSCNAWAESSQGFIGWEEAGQHLRCVRLQDGGRMYLEQRGVAAVKEVVRVLGLDGDAEAVDGSGGMGGDGSRDSGRGKGKERERERRVTAKELDKMDERFVCGLCEVQPRSRGRQALSWRGCVAHYLDITALLTHKFDTPPRWIRLAPYALHNVKARERKDTYYRDKAWCCNLCAINWDRRGTRGEIMRHVVEEHKIPSPIENTHFFYFDKPHRWPRPVRLVERPMANLRCGVCPPERSSRLFFERGVRDHLRDKHQIEQPQENEHYFQMELFLNHQSQ
ncbi:hypothetical protein AX16_001254 [Volvariella volvacea WC 439]|nr:hypothetical protein AX16_001254 [Volvariella volvacea WC 439]